MVLTFITAHASDYIPTNLRFLFPYDSFDVHMFILFFRTMFVGYMYFYITKFNDNNRQRLQLCLASS